MAADDIEVLAGNLVPPNADISRISFTNQDEINEKTKDLNSSSSLYESNNFSGCNQTSTAQTSHLSNQKESSLDQIRQSFKKNFLQAAE